MEDLNQLKIVLVKKKRTSKWLAEQLGVNQTYVLPNKGKGSKI